MRKNKRIKLFLLVLLLATAVTIGLTGQTKNDPQAQKPKDNISLQNQPGQSLQKADINADKKDNKPQEAKQENQPAQKQPTDPRNSMIQYFDLGGPFMWPLLLFSIIVLGVLIERFFAYSKVNFNVKRFNQLILPSIINKNYDEAVEICKKNKKNFAADIFERAIPYIKKGGYEFEKSVESAAIVKVAVMEKNLNIFSTMGNLAPLTGFLGTVSGMIGAFKTIALADNVTAKLVAGGIYEALITTEVGLVIAIIAVGFNNYFVHRIDSSVNQIQELTDTIIEKSTRG